VLNSNASRRSGLAACAPVWQGKADAGTSKSPESTLRIHLARAPMKQSPNQRVESQFTPPTNAPAPQLARPAHLLHGLKRPIAVMHLFHRLARAAELEACSSRTYKQTTNSSPDPCGSCRLLSEQERALACWVLQPAHLPSRVTARRDRHGKGHGNCLSRHLADDAVPIFPFFHVGSNSRKYMVILLFLS
jgi:hypothetical protein